MPRSDQKRSIFSVPKDAQCSETNAEPIFDFCDLDDCVFDPANQIQKL